jgi:hypothetical protein
MALAAPAKPKINTYPTDGPRHRGRGRAVDRQNGTRLNVWCRVPGRRGNRPHRPVPMADSPRPLRQVPEHRLGIDTILPERLLGDVLHTGHAPVQPYVWATRSTSSWLSSGNGSTRLSTPDGTTPATAATI